MTELGPRCRVVPPSAPAGNALGALAVAAVLAVTGLACRCGGGAGADAAGAVRRYTVRGEVVRVGEARAGVREVAVRHEPIDGFADASGKVVGMASMVMPFEVPPSVPTEDVRAGDKVEMRFATSWSPPSMRVEAIRKLPPDTALRLGEARPASR